MNSTVTEHNSGLDNNQRIPYTTKNYSHYTAPLIAFPCDLYTALPLMLFS